MKHLLLGAVLMSGLAASAQDSIQARIVLIGDAGQLTLGKQPVVNAVRNIVPMDDKTIVLYLGDNLYKTGLPDETLPTYEIAKAPLDSQIHISGLNNTTPIYFLPGNHDWANGSRTGHESILRVQNYIDLLSNQYVTMLPRDGCPGPVEVEVNDDVLLVMMDSQWWLHEYDKPGIESDCPYKSKEEVLLQLDEIFSKNSSKLIIFGVHHPFKSYGPHGGYFTFKQHVFPFTDWKPNLYIPLPVLGSVYPLTRAVFGTIQDIKHPFYQEMIGEVGNVMKGYTNIIHVSGHEHALQHIVDSSQHYLVSGSGSKSTRVSKGRNSKYASSDNGFAVLNITKDKKVYASFYTVTDSVSNPYNAYLMEFSKVPIEAEDTLRQVEYAFEDSVVISASDKFKEWSGLKRVILGSNYRKVWNTPIALKVFNIRKEKGGLTIKSLGGGKQTKSLRLEDANGKEWTLRTVEKDPEKALPPHLRGTIAQGIVEDMISASHPYAPLVVADLAQAAGIIAAKPEFFFVPDDPALGYYRPLFANRVCMLEDRDPTVTSGDQDDSDGTGKIINKMLEDNEHHVDQQQVLNARLLDMLIGDFDRHNDQWKWGKGDTGKGKLYYPIPRDRDQAFFKSNGLLVKFLSQQIMPFLEGFDRDFESMKGVNYVAKDFDRFFLNGLNEEDWKKAVTVFTGNLTDSVLRNAATKLPREISAFSSDKIADILISRREELKKDAMEYYRILSRSVTVTGSNKRELFHLKKADNGLHLTTYKLTAESDTGAVMFNRTFDQKHTRELIIFGFNEADKFVVDDDVDSRIKVRFIGGKGNDTFDLGGNVRKFLYDLRQEDNKVLKSRRTNLEYGNNVDVIRYEFKGFEYNYFQFPQFRIGYNPEDGLLAGVGFTARTFGFRKEPYATNQKFTTLFAPMREAYQANYRGTFNQVISKGDLILNADFVNPTLNNFFGLGNSTKFEKDSSLSYYRTRYKYFEVDALIRKRFNDILHFSLGPTYYHYWNRFENNKDRILADPMVIGADSASIYGRKQYLGARSKLDIRYINNELNPTRGITWFTDFLVAKGMNDNSDDISRITSDMTIYAAVAEPSRINAILRFGVGHIFSRNFEYFQAMNLGANNYLRGFRKNRFSGRSMAYGSAELRYKLFTSRSYVFPGDVGLVGFYDIGRVWLEKESSRKWHSAYGGGIYYVPYRLLAITATVGFSEEESLFNLSIGTRFNLTF